MTTPVTPRFDEAAAPPATEPPPMQRLFRYESHTIPDPGAHLSVEEVRKALVLYFPDLVQATTTTQTEGETLVITFAKQTTRKGAAGEIPPSEFTTLAERLLALSALTETLTLPAALTLSEVAARRTEIQEALATHATATYDCERIYRRCLTLLHPTALRSRLPLGF